MTLIAINTLSYNNNSLMPKIQLSLPIKRVATARRLTALKNTVNVTIMG